MSGRPDRSRVRGVLVLVAAGAIALTSACGGSGGDDAAPATLAGTEGSSAAAASDSPDSAVAVRACDVVTLAELGDVLGREVILDGEDDNDFTCSYLTTGAGTLVFGISVGPASGPAAEVVADVLAMFDGAEAVDIGEAGYVAFEGAQVGFIQDGIDYQVNLGGGGLNPTESGDNTIAVARLVESKLVS